MEEQPMKTFVLLYSGGSMPEGEAEQKRTLKEWEGYFKRVGKGMVDQGNPFSHDRRTITSDGKVMSMADCPDASGYSIIRADSLDDAVAIAKSNPILHDGARISVYETFNAAGM
jgi:hypothetical protein